MIRNLDIPRLDHHHHRHNNNPNNNPNNPKDNLLNNSNNNLLNKPPNNSRFSSKRASISSRKRGNGAENNPNNPNNPISGVGVLGGKTNISSSPFKKVKTNGGKNGLKKNGKINVDDSEWVLRYIYIYIYI